MKPTKRNALASLTGALCLLATSGAFAGVEVTAEWEFPGGKQAYVGMGKNREEAIGDARHKCIQDSRDTAGMQICFQQPATSGNGEQPAAMAKTASSGEAAMSPAEGYNIHVQAPHLMADGTVGGPFHHYCKPISAEVLQCLLFESTTPKAKLVAVEYFVAKTVSRKEVPLIKWHRNFHDHKVEIATGRVKVLDQPPDKAAAIAEAASKTDGIIFHLWHNDQVIPDGKVTIPQSLGHIFTRSED